MDLMDDVARRLVSAGMSVPAARDKAQLFESILADLPSPGAIRLFVPGRIEFLGKHTDYAGGKSLVGAIERGIGFAAVARSDRKVVVRDALRGLSCEFEIHAELAPLYGTWGSYAMVVARRIARNFPDRLTGVEISFASDLSPAAGMSTSSALITGFFAIFDRLNRLSEHPVYRSQVGSREQLAGYLGAIENGSAFGTLAGEGGVGTFGGSQDHAALLLSEPRSLLLCRFDPVQIAARIPFPRGLALVIGVSGVMAEKTGAANHAYNQISRTTRHILGHWNLATGRGDPTLMAAVSSRPDGHTALREILEAADDDEFDHATMLARLEQVVMETTVLIPDAAEALRRGDLDALGATVDLSQMLAERMLGNQVPETMALARLAREEGAVAASAFGAGFGGSVYAVVSEEGTEDFIARWSGRYFAEYPSRRESGRFFETRLGPPVTDVSSA